MRCEGQREVTDDGYETVERYYFAEGRLFRVIDREGTVHNYADADWEEFKNRGKRLIEKRKKLEKLFM